EIKRVSALILIMVLALMTSSTIITAFEADSLRADDRNVRTLYDSYSAERGPILVEGRVIAESVPVDNEFKYLRTYLDPELYAHITGYFTLNQGNTGIEGELNNYLSGTASDQFLAQLNAILTGQSAKGASVELTIDDSVQRIAAEALGTNHGSVVAINPNTGAIIAMVSNPSYDPNRLALHNTGLVISAYNELLGDPTQPLVNRAISGDLYHPGSVFKLLVASAALDSGLLREDSTIANPASLQLPLSSTVIYNSGRGTCGPADRVTLADALRVSCNIPFAEIGAEIGVDVIRDYAERFGFGQQLGVPTAVTPSIFPPNPDAAQLMLSSFGQSDVRVTPLQIAMITAAIANGGQLMAPTLVDTIRAPDLSIIEPFTPDLFSTPISATTAETMKRLMVNNVDNGAASNGRINGVAVGGKTGTAQNGEGQPLTLWFTGFAPADNPQVAIAVVVENGTSFGNTVAAPIARQVMEAVLNR
ncbi:MAG TPA: penicillin-binding transpeptidase domain-containing protein, partial [Terrimesophilobacter sp.]|nr:penicillin-binding transpeptidase domain-containing protein [Terrimesophilobacter sp.]